MNPETFTEVCTGWGGLTAGWLRTGRAGVGLGSLTTQDV